MATVCERTAMLGITLALSLSAMSSCAAGNKNAKPPAVGGPSLSELIDAVRPSVVAVGIILQHPQVPLPTNASAELRQCFQVGDGTCIAGTGFFVNDNGDVVTASHVSDSVAHAVAELQALQVVAAPGIRVDVPNYESANTSIRRSTLDFQMQITSEDRGHDEAVLSSVVPNLFQMARRTIVARSDQVIPHADPKAVVFDLSRPLDGENVFACGYALGAAELSTTSGHVATAWPTEVPNYARQNGISAPIDMYHLDLSATLGNSGGPTFLTKNRAVTAMVVEVRTAPGGSSASAIPARYITEFLDKNHIPWTASATKK